jgi:hypothetical protein
VTTLPRDVEADLQVGPSTVGEQHV